MHAAVYTALRSARITAFIIYFLPVPLQVGHGYSLPAPLIFEPTPLQSPQTSLAGGGFGGISRPVILASM